MPFMRAPNCATGPRWEEGARTNSDRNPPGKPGQTLGGRDLKLDHAAACRFEGGPQGVEGRLTLVGADNRSARTGKVRARPARARGVDHLHLPRRQPEDPAADVEVLVDQPRQPVSIAI